MTPAPCTSYILIWLLLQLHQSQEKDIRVQAVTCPLVPPRQICSEHRNPPQSRRKSPHRQCMCRASHLSSPTFRAVCMFSLLADGRKPVTSSPQVASHNLYAARYFGYMLGVELPANLRSVCEKQNSFKSSDPIGSTWCLPLTIFPVLVPFPPFQRRIRCCRHRRWNHRSRCRARCSLSWPSRLPSRA